MPETSSEYEESLYFQQLHLHTLETLCNDLVGGHAVEYGSDSQLLSLKKPSRSALSWYRDNQAVWTKNLSANIVKGILDSLDTEPPDLEPASSASSIGEKKLLKLIRLEAHRFAGIHSYGTNIQAPDNFIFEPSKPITMFEGANGSGKTSLMNAIIWCLTGEIIRPQRPPESGYIEFEVEIEREEVSSFHNLPPVTPMPRSGVYVPSSEENIPVDTWVELTFEDQNGNILPTIRRGLSRTNRGKIQEDTPDLSGLGIDPISFRTSTTMPALLPFIQIGEQSELGRAVAELTGLSSLIALSKHAGKVSKKISGDLTKKTKAKVDGIDQKYHKILTELESKVVELPNLALNNPEFPKTSDDKKLENQLDELKSHFETCKANSFSDAAAILGEKFDTDNQKQIEELEGKISPAVTKIDEIRQLTSANRLAQLAAINDEQLHIAEELLQKVCDEAVILADLANNPDTAQRQKLYARIAEWMKEFNIDITDLSCCPVCSTEFKDLKDPVTDSSVEGHIKEHLLQDSTLISQSIQNWIRGAKGLLATKLPIPLSQESNQDLPDHPVNLIQSALSDELFSAPAFIGVLCLLKKNMAELFDEVFSGFTRLEAEGKYRLPEPVFSDANELQVALNRVERAIAFVRWRQSNKNVCIDILNKIIGSSEIKVENKKNKISSKSTLLDRLYALQNITKSAKPINKCLGKVDELKQQVKLRRMEEDKLARYSETVEALAPIEKLGNLAEQQITDLQTKLKNSTEKWRNAVYKNYYSNSGHALTDTRVAPEGALSISVGSNGTVAPAQHVSNASALRASLLGFYIAFWEHVLRNRGGLQLMLLDDPQELLDEENEERLADSLSDIANINAQLFITTHDQRFATMATKVANSLAKIEHRSVHPVNHDRHTLKTPLAVADIDKKQQEFFKDVDDANRARDYISECRVFIEARLSDLFDDPAYTTRNHHPTLMDYVNQARSLRNQNPAHELFGSTAFKKLCEDQALQDGAKCLARLNTAHHEGKRNIMPSDVNEIKDDLARLLKITEMLHKEFRLYRRREPSPENAANDNVTILQPANSYDFNVPIFPDLAAFTGQPPAAASQDIEQDTFSGSWLEDKALFYLRNDMFGFSAPAGSIAIVKIGGEPPKDQNLVIAKYNKKYLARRLLRDTDDSAKVTLATVSTDPRARPPSIVVTVNEVELFRVVGILFGGEEPREMLNKHDAVEIQDTQIFQQIETCHRLRDTSAEPLALERQLVLGGKAYLPEDLIRNNDQIVAVALDDGSGVCKRIGGCLPGDLSYLCQFESIGGKGKSTIASLNKEHSLGNEMRSIETVRQILGVIYEY